MINKYVKRPIVIEAVQWKGDNIEDIFTFCNNAYKMGDRIMIRTLEGVMEARVGCYIIKGIKGEFYPCDHEIFNETYSKVDE